MKAGRRHRRGGADQEPITPPSQAQSNVPGQQGRSRRSRGRRTRKLRGGMGYGFGGTIGTAGPVWNQSWGGEITKAGTPIYDTADRPAVTGGRRRKGGKTHKVTRSRRAGRKTMKGGMTVAHASAGFRGDGVRGMAISTDVGGETPFANNVVPLA